MLDPKNLLERVLGGNALSGIGKAGQLATDRLNGASGAQGFAGGAVAGGLLGLVLGSKKMRKMASGALGYGGAAALGALAHRAYQNYVEGRSVQSAPIATPEEISRLSAPELSRSKPGPGGRPLELVLIEAMVAAAKADGHVDAEEQQRLFAEVERLGLDAESKAYVFDLLSKPADPANLAAAATHPEQAGEVYLASRLAIDPDNPAEQAYLDALASRLQLSNELRAHLERQAVV
ncbi:MAG: tellurite resistance TerB family protein [Steroidobacteraceae bacterium]